jgi:hypothetical protein
MKLQLLLLAALLVGAAMADWLITEPNIPVTFASSASGTSMVLSNGLVSREFQIHGGFGTIQFFSHVVNRSLLRCVEPEAMITLDNISYFLGDLYQEEPLLYLNLSNCAVNSSAWGLALRHLLRKHRTRGALGHGTAQTQVTGRLAASV